jgi:transposase-like protein
MIALLRIIFFPLFKLLFEPELSCLYKSPSTTSYPPCPRCVSSHSTKNGSVYNGKPKRICKDCNRQFVINPTKKTVPTETKQLIDRLLLERISLRGVARVTEVSWSWLQNYVNDKLRSVPLRISITAKIKGKLTIECDELWSLVFGIIHFYFLFFCL